MTAPNYVAAGRRLAELLDDLKAHRLLAPEPPGRLVEVTADTFHGRMCEHERAPLRRWLERHEFDINDIAAVRLYPLGCVWEVELIRRDRDGKPIAVDVRGCEPRHYIGRDDYRFASYGLEAAKDLVIEWDPDDPPPISTIPAALT